MCELADYKTALPLLEHAHRLARLDAWCEGWQLAFIGKAALGLGALERARSSLEAALVVAQLNGEPHSMTPHILDALGEVGIADNEPRLARGWLIRSLELRHDSGERFGQARTLDRLASLAALCSEPERALKLLGAADRILQDLGGQRTPAEQQKLEHLLLPLRDKVGGDAADAAWSTGRSLALEEAVAFAHSGDETEAEEPAPSVRPQRASPLTTRELEVAALLARGMSNRRIADELVISLHTAQRHVENILSKLEFSSRTQVAAWAIGQGLATVSTPADAT